MGKDLDKESAEAWYQANKIAADRIINDLKKQSLKGLCIYMPILQSQTGQKI